MFTKARVLSLGIINLCLESDEGHIPPPKKDAVRCPPCDMHKFACIFRVLVVFLRAMPGIMLLHDVLECQGLTKVNEIHSHPLGACDLIESRASSPECCP